MSDSEEGKEFISQDVSMNESISGQGKASAEWNTINDTTDNDHLFERKFTCFSNMVEKLKNMRGYEFLSSEPKRLPKRARCKKHLLIDGSPRCVAIVKFRRGDSLIVILEIDTSDAEKALSTKAILVHDTSALDSQLGKIMAELVGSSLSWPNRLFTDFYGVHGHVGIPHPESKSGNKGVLSPDSVNGWANRCYRAIGKLR